MSSGESTGPTARDDGSTAGRHIAVNLVGETLSRVPQIVAELTFARILGPASFGIWKSLQLVIMITNFANLGIPAGLGKELPRAMGRGDPLQIRRLERVSLTGLAGIMTLITAVLLLLGQSSTVLGTLGVAEYPGLYYMNILNVWFSHFLVLYQANLRSQLRFAQVAVGTSVFAMIFLLLGVPATMEFGPGGIVTSYCVGYLLAILYTQARLDHLILPGWHRPTLGLLIRMGFPLVAYGAFQWMFVYCDRMLIVTLLSVGDLGMYGFVALMPHVMAVISTTIPRAILPILMRRLGASSQLSDSALLFLVTVLILSLFNGAVIGFLLPVATAAIAVFMPEYTGALGCMWILLFNTFLFALSTMALPYCIAGEHQVKMNLIAAVSLVANGLAGVTLISMGWGIVGVALGATLGQVVFLSQIYLDVTRLLELPPARAWRSLALACLPGLEILVLWVAGGRLVGWETLTSGEWGSLWTAGVWAMVNILALCPVGLLTYRKVRCLQREYRS